jgi:hypothetical protein
MIKFDNIIIMIGKLSGNKGMFDIMGIIIDEG